MNFRHRHAVAELKPRPRGGDLRADRRFDRAGVRFEDVLPDGRLRIAVAHPGGVAARSELPDQQRVNRVVAELQRPEIDVVAAGVCRVEQLDLGRIRENAAAVRPERTDDPLQHFALVLPGVLVDAGDDERHAEPLDEAEQVFERPVLQAVQPGQHPDFAAARRIRPPPVLVNDELIRNELHPVRKFLRHEARNHAVAQREAVRLDGLKPLDRAALFPDDFRR